MENSKIFCIGLGKTGTFSLHKALELLGYRSLHYKFKGKRLLEFFQENQERGRKLLDGLEQYNAFLDFDPARFYKMLDHQYPGSKFIFTVRDLDSWMRSRKMHVWMNRLDPFYKFSFLKINKKEWKDLYHNYSRDVAVYFSERSGQLLTLRICDGEGWEKLCPFLNKAVPKVAFPKKNTFKKKFLRILKKRIEIFRRNFKRTGELWETKIYASRQSK